MDLVVLSGVELGGLTLWCTVFTMLLDVDQESESLN
jgi:hypothetical protein